LFYGGFESFSAAAEYGADYSIPLKLSFMQTHAQKTPGSKPGDECAGVTKDIVAQRRGLFSRNLALRRRETPGVFPDPFDNFRVGSIGGSGRGVSFK